MKLKPYVVIDGERNYEGLVIDLLNSFGQYPHRFNPQHIPEKCKENPRNGVDGEIVHHMRDNETLAVILKPIPVLSKGKIESHRIINFPIRRADYVIKRLKRLCESKGCKVHDDSTRHINMPKIAGDYHKDLKNFYKLQREILEDLG